MTRLGLLVTSILFADVVDLFQRLNIAFYKNTSEHKLPAANKCAENVSSTCFSVIFIKNKESFLPVVALLM